MYITFIIHVSPLQDCFLKLYAPRCAGCNKSISENYISALNQQWCPGCFVCAECKEPNSAYNILALNLPSIIALP